MAATTTTLTTTTGPVGTISGAPVTERATRIAAYLAAQRAYYTRVAATSTGTAEDIAFLEEITATIVNATRRYDYYNWTWAA